MKRLFGFKGLLSILFYIALLALIWYLIIPRTGIYYRKSVYRPFIGQLNKIDITLINGETEHLYVLGLNKRVKFSSSDIKVADITIFGGIRSFRTGTTIIRAKVDGKVLKCRVRVIDINKKNLKLKLGEEAKLKIEGSKSKVRWKSEDESIATVDKNGNVLALSVGKTVITGEVHGRTLTCTINVKK